MDFTRLPIHLIESILNPCDFGTIRKMKQTCSTVNAIIKRKKIGKLDVHKIAFCRPLEITSNFFTVDVEHSYTPLKIGQGIKRFFWFKKGNEATKNDEIKRKIQKVLNNVRHLDIISFDGLRIDEEFMEMIKSLDIAWNHVSVELRDCSYRNPRSDLIIVSKIFKSVLVMEFQVPFIRCSAHSFDDQFICQTMSKIVIDSNKHMETPNITDKSSQIFEETKPPVVLMCCLIPNFTVDGIIRFFKKMLLSRDASVEDLCIGSLRFEYDDYILINDIFYEEDDFYTEYSTIQRIDKPNYLTIKMFYKEENSENEACISVILMKPNIFVDQVQDEEIDH